MSHNTDKKKRAKKWKSLPASEKKKIRKMNRKAKRENWKCSGKKSCHGMRSSVAKTWDSSKGKSKSVKTVAPASIPEDRLDAMSVKISEASGYSFKWVREQRPQSILRLARKHL